MRYALISDIHGNLPALEAVLADIDARPEIDAVHHLGDLVGYGPWPDEVVSLLRERRIGGIAGNKDSKLVAASRTEMEGGSPSAPPDWTRSHTSRESTRYLARLPFRLDLRPGGGHLPGPTVMLVHGTPELNTRYWPAEQPDSFCLEMAALAGAKTGDVICFGHTHLPWHREVEGIHFLNTGSVGRPKDGDWRAGYVVLDMSGDAPAPEFVRLEYDIGRTVEAIRRSGLSDDLAEFLRTGGRPSPASEEAGSGGS